MLVSLTVLVTGIATGAFVRTRWRFRFGLFAVLPVVAVATLWNWTVLPVVGAGAAVTYLASTDGRRRWSFSPVSIPGALVAGAAVPVGVYIGLTPFRLSVAVLAVLLSWIVASQLVRIAPERRRIQGLAAAGSLVGLLGLGLALLWARVTPPCLSCAVLARPLRAYHPRLLRHPRADAFEAVAGGLAGIETILSGLAVIASLVGTLVFVYLLLSMIGSVRYTAQRGRERVADLTLVLVTIASESVRDALMEAIEHNRTLFEDYDFTVVIDEGADLQPELEAMDIDLVVVPAGYDPEAIAKGRAIQYFIEHHVAADEWYAFVDDDNLIRGREFLYEIPKQEADGKLVMNPILVPRTGESTVTFAIDHMRTLFDFSFFRTFTGVLGRPYAGLHGELLCARGDVLIDVGFDRKTIVEDFAFADELVRRGIETWQSRTVVSFLSPHSLADYYDQRARWFVGKVRWLPRSTPGVVLVTGLIQSIWLLGIFGGWLVGAVWFLAGPPADVVYLLPALLSAGFYSAIYTFGVARSGLRNLPKIVLIPVYATIEHTAPYVALLKRSISFDVIRK